MTLNNHEALQLLLFAEKVEAIHAKMVGLSIFWDTLREQHDALTDGYPFGEEFGEQIEKVYEWSQIIRAHSETLESMAETYAEENAE